MDGPKLIVYAGSMGGQKSAYAILDLQKVRDGTPHLGYKAFKPRNSVREGIDANKTKLVSRAGPTLEASIIDETNPGDIFKQIRREDLHILIEEAHMFEPRNLKKVIEDLLDQKKIVRAITLTTDYGGRVFPITQYLIGRATEFKLHHGICRHPGCEEPGIHNQLYFNGKIAPYQGAKLFTADVSSIKKSKDPFVYQAKCLSHFIIPPNAPNYIDEVIRL